MKKDNELILKSRVRQVFDQLKVSANELQRITGISHSTISSQVTGKSKMVAATIMAILENYPIVSAEWLMRGTGKMILSSTEVVAMDKQGISKDEDTTIVELREIIRRQQREIDGLYERIDELKRANSIAAQRSAMVG